MWKIQTTMATASLRQGRAKGSAAGWIQRVLVSSTSNDSNSCGPRRCYGRTPDAGLQATPMTVPPNLLFDSKSSFAPQKQGVTKVEKSDENDIYEDDLDEEPLLFSPGMQSSQQQRLLIPLPDRLHVPIHTVTSEEPSGTLWLEPSVFGVQDIRLDLLTQNVNYIRNKIRGMRSAKSKTISEVSGSGRKVRAQKGGGIARAGHSRPAHWRGGAKAHGPKNTKNYGNCKLNKKTKALAIRSVLSQKLMEGNLCIVDNLKLDSHKTGPWAKILEGTFGVGKARKKTKLKANPHLEQTTSALILDHYHEPETEDESDFHASYRGVPINLWVASSNIPRVTVRNHRFLNVYDVLQNEKLILTLSALNEIEEKWKDQ